MILNWLFTKLSEYDNFKVRVVSAGDVFMHSKQYQWVRWVERKSLNDCKRAHHDLTQQEKIIQWKNVAFEINR